MSFDLDPKEVLQHLHALGYCNISPDLLKEFIRDLKKLIKYDQKKGFLNRQKREKACCHHQEDCDDMNENGDICEEEEQSGAQTYRRINHCRNQSDECCDEELLDESESSAEENRPDSRNTEGTRKENIPPSSRPPSSFIRPGNVGAKCKPRSDPVALYHYYQGIWSQNPQPGEDPRAQLRWNIRHQMMGKQKPVVPSCGCPCCQYRLVEGRLPEKCPPNDRELPHTDADQNPTVEDTYSNFDPVACSSNNQLNHAFNGGLENTVTDAPDAFEVRRDKKVDCEKGSKKGCSKCGKKTVKLKTEKRSFEKKINVCDKKINGITIGDLINKIRVVTEINFL